MAVTDSPRRQQAIGAGVVLGLAGLTVAAIATQLFVVGLNVFVRPTWWGLHIRLGHLAGVLVGLQAISAWVAWLPRQVRWLSLGLVALYGLQYNIFAIAGLLGTPYVIPLHAVNALALFWGAIWLVQWAGTTVWQQPRRLARRPTLASPPTDAAPAAAKRQNRGG